MSTNKMLIDATHPEETRVVVLRGGRVEEFDYESAARKLLRGNIYLAKVTRVEPSLQAAFVDYGGNRHGFLAFNEIHPDYYQIPVADRQALLDEEAAAEAEEEAAADARAERLARRRSSRGGGRSRSSSREEDNGESASEIDGGAAEFVDTDADDDEPEVHHGSDGDIGADEGPAETIAEAVVQDGDVLTEDVAAPEAAAESPDETEASSEPIEDVPSEELSSAGERGEDAADAAEDEQPSNSEDGEVQAAASDADSEDLEQTGTEDALEELPSRPRRRPRSYKIQEVIKRRQVILVQVVKEERGNKGAALTTYLSLAGRYTVLMPNTARGGGISRKITNPQDRKRLKAIATDLDVPEGMGLIIRTAGAARTKQEIKRDFEYLLRLWESVRDLTLESTAPSLVYEEGNLIKRSIRDLYNKEVEEIVVAGDHAHKDAKDFMRMLMPSHARNVILHQDPEPLFTRYGIERQLNAMFSPYVTLKSGGYLVVNQTEALVAIDVNSGKATREFSIEETALNTNLEASDEIARQLKLRDLAGLVVIDFIDMEEKRNNRAVERRLKDALRYDRARIQLGRISHFGLMEMSRQRMRSGVLEGSTSQCPHCQGTGIIRSTESVALAVLRGLEDALMAGARASLVATTTPSVALYILNNKRHFINDMEQRNGIAIAVEGSEKMQGANFTIEKGNAAPVPSRRSDRAAVNMDWGFEGEGTGSAELARDPDAGDAPDRETSRQGRSRGEGREDGSRRRRRGRRGEGSRRNQEAPGDEPRSARGDASGSDLADVGANGSSLDGELAFDGDGSSGESDFAGGGSEQTDEQGVRKRRRGRRGGRRGRERSRAPADDAILADSGRELDEASSEIDVDEQPVLEQAAESVESAESNGGDAPQPVPMEAAASEPSPVAKEPRPRARPRRRAEAASTEPKIERVVVTPNPDQPDAAVEAATAASPEPARRGWWQRRLSGSE
jgi:ribonuclease E